MADGGNTVEGRRDYTYADKAPVVVCFIRCGDRYLLLKRSGKVLAYQGKWSVLAGFIDTDEPLETQIVRELDEELGLPAPMIEFVKPIDVYEYRDLVLKRTWIRHIFLVGIKTSDIQLNWEHSEFRWLSPSEIGKMATTPGLEVDLEKVLALGV
jgi:8-oxo-dGTP pyrophosphatase MutT (NUDIX family)